LTPSGSTRRRTISNDCFSASDVWSRSAASVVTTLISPGPFVEISSVLGAPPWAASSLASAALASDV